MRKILMGIALLTLLTAIGCTTPAPESQKMAVVDMAKVFQESQVAKQGMDYLQAMNRELQQELTEMQAGSGGNQTEEEVQKMQQAINEYRTKLNTEQQRIVTILNDEFQKFLDSYREENNFSVILAQENVLAMDEELDVTEQIITEFDKVAIDLEASQEGAGENPMAGETNSTMGATE